MVELKAVALRKIENLLLNLQNLTQPAILRCYIKDPLGAYQLSDLATYPSDFLTSLSAIVVRGVSLDADVRVTCESLVEEAEARDIPFVYVTRSLT